MRSFTGIVTLALAACASALTVSTPSSASAGSPVTIAWSATGPNDPAGFTLFLLNFNNLPFGLEQNFGEVTTADGQRTFTLDSDLSSDKTYIIRAVKSDNVDWVIAESSAFRLV